MVHSRRGPFPFELEDHNTSVVTGSEQVDFGVGRDDPEPVLIALERLDGGPLVEVPYSNGFVFADGENQVLVGMEQTGRSVLEMAAAGIDFPCFRV